MIRLLILCSLLCFYAHGWTMTRRTAVWGGCVACCTQVLSETTSPAVAYERRDVGGENRSAEQAAYNLQAYETNNRLERQGLKLETQAEQQASLTAALADYSYTPAAKSKNDKQKESKGSGSKTIK